MTVLQILGTSALAFLALASAAFSGVSLWISLRVQSVSPVELLKQVHILQSDVQDLYDRVDAWQRRDRVRTLRASREVVTPPAPVPGSPEFKQALRVKAGLMEIIAPKTWPIQ